MKHKIVLAIVLFFISSFSYAQTMGRLWGMTSDGGDSGGGVIFNYDKLISYDSTVFTMPSTPETPYYTTLLQASDGNFYGMTEAGGFYGSGTVFMSTPSGVLTTVVSFNNSTSGSSPRGSLIQATDGNLYGMALGGGTSNCGTIFKCSLTGTLTVLVNFNSTANGSLPMGSLIQATDGDFYGMTSAGGSSGMGIIFKCTSSGTLTSLVNFNSTSGGSPDGSLIQGADGNLYGMTHSGGSSNLGTIFKCTTSGVLIVLVNFNGNNGSSPIGSLMQAADGNLYGMTSAGGSSDSGTIFKCTTSGALNTLVSLDSATGFNPHGNLIQATDGNLYGMTFDNVNGTVTQVGTIFKYSTTGSFSTLFAFNGINGLSPFGSLIQATDGNLYGMTYEGGISGDGNIFECTTSGTFTNLATFGITAIGYNPGGSLIQAKDGNLYGMTFGGGTNGYDGTMFKYNPVTTRLSVLVNFYDSNGANPYGSLIQASDSNFYGMTNEGGSDNKGVIFKYTRSGVFSVLVNFIGSNGSEPFGSLIQGTDGNLYGVTYLGGSSHAGTLFKCTTSGTLTTLVNFNGTNGSSPFGSLIQASDGNLYGTTIYGGSANDGTLFQCTTAGVLTTIVSFTGTANGSYPRGDLVQGIDGNLYGLTVEGGSLDYGTLFKSTTSGALTTLISFNATNGRHPSGSLIQASDSNFYGYTIQGGASDDGVVFKYTSSGNFSTLITFNGSGNGSNPQYGKLLEVMSASIKETCPDTALMAEVRGAKEPYTYLWSNNATTSSIKVTTTGTYSVMVTDARGITVYDTIIYSGPFSVTAGSGSTICSGASVGLSASASGGIGSIIYTWMPGNINGANPSVSPSVTTVYTVTAAEYGCSVNANLTITVTPLPSISITGKSDIVTGGVDTLVASGACTYTWTTGSTKDTFIVSPAATTTYTVNGTCSGCSTIDTFTVHVNSLTGIAGVSKEISVLAYPNPVLNILNLSLGMMTDEKLEAIEIEDISGRDIYNSNGVLNNIPYNNRHTLSVDVSNLASGMYFVKIVTSENIEVAKFVKQ